MIAAPRHSPGNAEPADASGPEWAWTQHPSLLRREIEDAAAKLFAAKGIDGATTREIAAAAGCSEGAIYRYWPSKEALARGLFMAAHRRIASDIRNCSATGSTIEEQAASIVRVYCGFADRQWDRFAFHLLSTGRFLPTPEEEDNPVAAAEDVVRAAMQRGEIPEGDPALVAAMALGVVLQTALHKIYGRIAGELRPLAPGMTRAVIAVLKSGGGAA